MKLAVLFLERHVARVLGDDDSGGGEKARPADLAERVVILADRVVGRIEEDEVETCDLFRQPLEPR